MSVIRVRTHHKIGIIHTSRWQRRFSIAEKIVEASIADLGAYQVGFSHDGSFLSPGAALTMVTDQVRWRGQWRGAILPLQRLGSHQATQNLSFYGVGPGFVE